MDALQVEEVIYAQSQAESIYPSQQEETKLQQHQQQQHRINAQPFGSCISSKVQHIGTEKLEQKASLSTYEHFLRLSAMEYGGVTESTSAALNLSGIGCKDLVSGSKPYLEETQELSMHQQVNVGADVGVVGAADAKVASNRDEP
ncbi:uncharacterized protein LOC117889572 [Drosophila subobscura]|uniref:uncharacterized protein LOC117889572 n=1 Tax=Drosophila subobscura TaxID=7241 RepID=UPI00155A1429|nr:uncharacterized protein LOC117889572 [Drosophila subobscura]